MSPMTRAVASAAGIALLLAGLRAALAVEDALQRFIRRLP